MLVNTRHELKRLEADLELYPKELLAASVSAFNRAASAVRAEGVRRLGAHLPGLRRGAVRRQIALERASRARPVATLSFSEKRFRLFGNFAEFSARRGVRLRGMPWRIETLDGEPVGPVELARAFIQRPAAGGPPHVWIRYGAKRYPITALLAPSLASALVAKKLDNALVLVGHDRFSVAFAREARFRLSRRPAV